MKNAADFDCVEVLANEEQPVISDTQSQFLTSSKSFHVARTRLGEAM